MTAETIGQAAVEAGIDEVALDRLLAAAATRVSPGPLPSCQIAVARHGQVVCSASFGAATDETKYLIYSATKPVVASAVWLLLGEGLLDLSTPVAEYIPEFGLNGKEGVTVEHVLLHTGGFPNAPLRRELWTDRPGRLQQFAAWELETAPGTRFVYHGNSAHWVLAELVERGTDMDFRAAIATRIFEPLGLLDTSIGVPVERQDGIPQVVSIGTRGTLEEMLAVKGTRELPPASQLDTHFLQYNLPESRAAGTPSSGCVSSAPSIALFYQALLRNPGGLWNPEVLADATSKVRNSLPVPGLGIPADRSIGLMIAGEGPSHFRHLYGDGPSPRAFGHTGAAGQISWADPETGISFVFLTNALDADLMRQHRDQREICDVAAAIVKGAK